MIYKIFAFVGVLILSTISYFSYHQKAVPVPPAEVLAPSVVVMTLERTPCFGTCPSYKLTISGDGTVAYEGKRFVKTVGTKTFQISADKIKELTDAFYSANYFSLEDKYTAGVSDMPTKITSFTVDDKTKTITDYFNAPKELTDLENKIDEVTNSKSLIGKCTSPNDTTKCTDAPADPASE